MKAVLADIHAHNWSAFSTTLPGGLNSRLQIILKEIERAARELRVRGGPDSQRLIIAGDLFHIRGHIDPEVFNPVFDLCRRLCGEGFKIDAIPGNHDLKGKETTELGNAIQTLGTIEGFTVITEPLVRGSTAFVPWQPTVETTIQAVEKLAGRPDAKNLDLVLHAPMNGVIKGLPDIGLDPAEMARWGFRRVFCGHYHNHAEPVPGVYSIGALTHQTWSDVGSRAGFLLVSSERVEWRASHAPKFVEITDGTDPDEIPLIADGNYVRVRLGEIDPDGVKLMRHELEKAGAKGVVFHTPPKAAVKRTGMTVKAGASLEASVASYVDKLKHPRGAELSKLCQEILAEARSMA